MIWWFKARRAHFLLPIALAVFAVGLYAVQDTSVLLPSLTGSPKIALSLFVPVPLLALLMAVLESRLPAAEATGIRPTARFDSALVAAVGAVAVLCSVLVAAAEGTSTATAGGRNTLFLAGLMLLGRAWVGQTAVMVPVAWLVVVVLVGFRQHVPRPWNVVGLPADDVFAAAAALVVFAAGLATQIRPSRKSA